jgi:hypothetical protein
MPDVLENTLQLTARGDVKPSTELDVSECFAPFIPQVLVSTAPKPAPKPRPSGLVRLCDEMIRDMGLGEPPPTDTAVETAASADVPGAQPSEIPIVPVEAPLPPPRKATAIELFTWIKHCVQAQTHLPEDVAELVSFWTISTWFQDVLTILPCLIITGSAHDGGSLLHILGNLCRRPALLAGFQRSHLGVLRWGCETNLVSEPNLDKRTAALLSSLTDRRFLVVEGGSLTRCSKSTAIYAGENPTTHKIQHSIHRIRQTNAH